MTDKSSNKTRESTLVGLYGIVFYTVLLILLIPILGRQFYGQDLFKALYSGRYLYWFQHFPNHSVFKFNQVFEIVQRDTYNWFGNLVLYLSYSFGGYYSLLLIRSLIVLCVVVLLHSLIDWNYHPFVLIILVLAVYGLSQNLLIRTALFVAPFTLLLFWLWDKIRFRGKRQWIWFYPLLFTFWGNLHGSYIMGFGCLILVFTGDVFDGLCSDRNLFSSENISYAMVLLLIMGVITSVKPFYDMKFFSTTNGAIYALSQGLGIDKESSSDSETPSTASRKLPGNPSEVPLMQKKVGHLLDPYASKPPSRLSWSDSLYNSARSILQQTIFKMNRFRSDEFNFPFDRPELLLTRVNFFLGFLGVLIFLLAPSKIRFSYLLPFAVVLIIGLGYMRTIGYITLVAVPILFTKYRLGDLRCLDSSFKNPWVIITVVFALSLLLGNVSFNVMNNSISKITQNPGHSLGVGTIFRYNNEFANDLLRKYPDEKFYNSYGLGSYLVWRWWPYKKVFIDSKYSAYPDSFRTRYTSMPLPDQLRSEGINFAVFESGNFWLIYFKHSEEWERLERRIGMVTYERVNKI